MPLHDVLRQRFQPLTSAVTANRIFLYAVFSTFAVAATIANACRQQSNFYSVSIFLSKSSRSVLILANFGILCALLCGRIFQRIFFGSLQPREVERLYDQTWMFVTESLLAFTIFRDEFDVPFLLMFGFLLFVKCFHWLMADRVESMDQTPYPGPPTLFHIRINSLFLVLWAIDISMFALAVESTLTNGVGGMVLFASEYAILLASSLNAMLRYTLSILDLRRARTRGGENAPPWENKSMYIFYIELLTDFLKLTTYMTFFMIILTFYGLPLNIIRDVFVTARSFITRLRALVRYHNATRDMDRRYPDATEAELAEMSDRTCIICREEMHPRTAAAPAPERAENGDQPQEQPLPPADGPNVTPKKLPCGHIFHFQCLRSWLERQQSCPTCRRTVLDNNAARNTRQAPVQGQAQQGAARPLPGAAPVPGALQGPPGAAVAGNGPLGWFGRVLGIPQAPALNPQFPGQVGAAGAAFPPNLGWVGAVPPQAPPLQPPHPAPVFYDPAQGWQPYRAPGQPIAPPPQMQQPPVFNGFYGPGHIWQPWGDPRLFGQQPPAFVPLQPGQHHPQQQRATTPPQAEAQQAPRPPSAAAPTEGNNARSAVGSQAPTPTPSSPSSSSGSSSSIEDSADARRAAAMAALRRLNPSAAARSPQAANQTTERRPNASSTGVAIPSVPVDTPSTPSTSAALPPTSIDAGPSASTSAEPAPSSTAGPVPAQPPPHAAQAPGPSSLPSLIPLYDTSIVQPTRVPGVNPFYAPYSHFYRTPGARPPTYAPGQRTSGQAATTNATSQSYLPRSARAGPGGSRTPLTQLPPTLTEEQLARLDRLTREAIDERLRVLEGVSGAIWRCMEELHRVRTVLPQRRQGQQQSGVASGSAEVPPAPSSSSSTAPAAVDTPAATDAASGSSPGSGSGPSAQNGEAKEVHEARSSSAAFLGSATPSEDGSSLSEAGEGVALEAGVRGEDALD